jgi:hypothetical protein
MGEGLQFSSVVALTVSFGLGLSATIHFLNRSGLRTVRAKAPARWWNGRRSWSARRSF